MKKIVTVLMCLAICIAFCGCEKDKEIFVFDDFGIEVKMRTDKTVCVSHDKSSMLISDVKSGDPLGVISVDKQKDTNINKIYDLYVIGDGEKIKTELSDNLMFVEIIYKVDSVALGERDAKAYCFIFYDESTGALLFGRFFEICECDFIIDLAKSIEIAII